MSISLSKAVRTCKVEVGYANRLESERFLDPQLMVCQRWNGTDLMGRTVCPDSFYTKQMGCSSAMDRVVVENLQRPQYFEYITLDAGGLQGISEDCGSSKSRYGSCQRASTDTQENFVKNSKNYTGNFGLNLMGNLQSSCNSGKCTTVAQGGFNSRVRQASANSCGSKSKAAFC